jgi:hypothetical protein
MARRKLPVSFLLLVRRRFNFRQYAIEILAIQKATVYYNSADLLGFANVCERVRIKQDQVGKLSLSNGAE